MSAARHLLPLLALVATIPLISAHGSMVNIAVGGKEHPSWIPSQDHYAAVNFKGGAGAAAPDGKYLRKNDVLDNGYTDPASAAIATGGTKEGALYDEMSPVKAIPMNAGDAVTFNLGTWPEGHSGPILSHMASCGSATCTGVDATTLDWFAIHHAGYDATAKIWPTDVLATTGGGALTIDLPKDLPGGAYLLRFELIAMHSVPAQFYPWAAEIDLTSSGSSLPGAEYMGKFPDMYSAAAGNMALDFSLYSGNDLMSFVLPGVPVYPGGSSTGNDPRADGSAAPEATATAPATNETAPTVSADPAATVSNIAPDTSILPTASEIAGNPIEGAPTASTTASTTSETIPAGSATSEIAPGASTTTDLAPGMTDIPLPLPEPTDIDTDATGTITSDAQITESATATGTATDGAGAEIPVETSEGVSSAVQSASASDPASAPEGVETATAPVVPTGSDAGVPEVVPTATATATETENDTVEPTESAVAPPPPPPPAAGTDEVQEVQENGTTVYKWNGITFNFRNDAYRHMCDQKRNDCLDLANALPNAEVESARQGCETEAPACYSSISSSMRRRRRSARSHI